MNGVFQGCSKLTSIDVSSFDTSKVNTMVDMFNGCSELKKLDITNFDMGNVYHINRMFDGCHKLANRGIKINRNSIKVFERRVPEYYVRVANK